MGYQIASATLMAVSSLGIRSISWFSNPLIDLNTIMVVSIINKLFIFLFYSGLSLQPAKSLSTCARFIKAFLIAIENKAIIYNQ